MRMNLDNRFANLYAKIALLNRALQAAPPAYEQLIHELDAEMEVQKTLSENLLYQSLDFNQLRKKTHKYKDVRKLLKYMMADLFNECHDIQSLIQK